MAVTVVRVTASVLFPLSITSIWRNACLTTLCILWQQCPMPCVILWILGTTAAKLPPGLPDFELTENAAVANLSLAIDYGQGVHLGKNSICPR